MDHKAGAAVLLIGVASVLAIANAQGNQCNCINLKQCPPLLSKLTSPNRQPSDIQLLRDSQCGFEGTTPKVCCPAVSNAPVVNNFGQNGNFGQPGGNFGQQGNNGNFGQPNGNFGQPNGNFGQPNGNFGQPNGNFGQPNGNFGQPNGNFGQPNGNFGQPNGNFGQQGNNFGQQGNFGQGSNAGQQVDVSRLLPTECGQDLSNRIVGGNITDILEYPWMALLEYRKPNGKTTACGGVLISKRYVLTAAHCLKGKTLPRSWHLESVRLGEYNTATDVDCVPEGDDGGEKCSDPPVTIRIEEQIAHEDYAPSSNDQRYDIALLRLSQDAPYTDYIRPICLPDNSNLASRLTAAGWGSTETRKESDIKLKVNLPLTDFRQCSAVYQRNGVILGEGQLCAGGEKGFDSCRGDSGGPLMMREKEKIPRWKVAGIVSFGPSPCGMEGFPGIYTKVYDYLPWIKSKIRA